MKKVLISALVLVGILSSLPQISSTGEPTVIKQLNHGANY